MKIGKAEWRGTAKNIMLTILGTMILAFGTAVFILPFELVSGGVSGIAIIIERLLPEGLVAVDIIVTVLTWTLFLIGFLVLGRAFAVKTLISTVVYPIGTALFLRLADPSFANGFFCLQASSYANIAPLLATLFGGLCVGTGCAVTFLGGGSTGGVDIIAFSLCRIFKKSTGYTPISYLKQYRVLKSCYYLMETDKKISEIASLCGYKDSSYFARTYKKIIGHAPNETPRKPLSIQN